MKKRRKDKKSRKGKNVLIVCYCSVLLLDFCSNSKDMNIMFIIKFVILFHHLLKIIIIIHYHKTFIFPHNKV